MVEKTIIAILFAFFVISCNNVVECDYIEDNRESIISATRSIDTDSLTEDLNRMLELGIDTTNLLVRDSYYVAGGVYVPKNILRDHSIPQTRISQNSNIHRHFYNVYYRIPIQTTSNMYQATVAGIRRWNQINNDCALNVDCGPNNRHDTSYFQVNIEFMDFLRDDPLVAPMYEGGEAPYSTMYINTNNPLLNIAIENNQYVYLIMHLVGESLRFQEVDTYDIYNRSIMMSDDLLETHHKLWLDLTAEDIVGVINAFPKQAEPEFSYIWNPTIETTQSGMNLFQKGVEYTLTIESNGNCCQNSIGTSYGIDITKDGAPTSDVNVSEVSSTTNSFHITFDERGQYELSAWVNDGEIRNLHLQGTDLYVVENEFIVVPPASVGLNYATNLQYKYYHPDHQNITYDFSVEEAMFGAPLECLMQVNENVCIVTPQDYGCYYIDAIVKSDGVEIDRKTYNLTVLNDMGVNVEMIYDLDASDMRPRSMYDTYVNHYYYDIVQERPSGNNARTAYFFEYETETQTWNEAPTRAVCRNWFLDYNLITFAEGETEKRSVLQMVQHGDMLSYRDAYYQYYTGNVYCPVNGLRLVDDKNILSLPMHRIGMPIKNIEVGPQVAKPELNILSCDIVHRDYDENDDQ